MKKFKTVTLVFLCAAVMLLGIFVGFDSEIREKETTTIAETTQVITQTTTRPVPVTVESTEKPSPNISYAVHETVRADKSYFDDVVFVGDSVSLKLYYYDMKTDCLGNAVFLTSGSLGVANCLWDLNAEKEVHPTYQGTKMRVPDGVIASGRSKVYIMLGMNDIYLYGIDGTIDNVRKLVSEIKTGNPKAEIFMQSVTPIYGNKTAITNDLVNQYNVKLSELCRQQKWNYLDVATALRDESGGLPLKYCGDADAMGIHFTEEGCQVWSDYLYTHIA